MLGQLNGTPGASLVDQCLGHSHAQMSMSYRMDLDLSSWFLCLILPSVFTHLTPKCIKWKM